MEVEGGSGEGVEGWKFWRGAWRGRGEGGGDSLVKWGSAEGKRATFLAPGNGKFWENRAIDAKIGRG